MEVKWEKIPSLTALQVAKYMWTVSNVHEPLKNRTYLDFLGANFLTSISSYQGEKEPVLRPENNTILETCLVVRAVV